MIVSLFLFRGRKKLTPWPEGLLRAVRCHFAAAFYSSNDGLSLSEKLLSRILPCYIDSSLETTLQPCFSKLLWTCTLRFIWISWFSAEIQKARLFISELPTRLQRKKYIPKWNSRLHLALGLLLTASMSILLNQLYSYWILSDKLFFIASLIRSSLSRLYFLRLVFLSFSFRVKCH